MRVLVGIFSLDLLYFQLDAEYVVPIRHLTENIML